MGPKPESVPQGAAEVVFLLSGTLTVAEGQTPWGLFPERLRSGQAVVGTTYTWTGEGAWRTLPDGQGGSGEGQSAGKEEGRVGDAERGRLP